MITVQTDGRPNTAYGNSTSGGKAERGSFLGVVVALVGSVAVAAMLSTPPHQSHKTRNHIGGSGNFALSQS
jgi:hypothetical protein